MVLPFTSLFSHLSQNIFSISQTPARPPFTFTPPLPCNRPPRPPLPCNRPPRPPAPGRRPPRPLPRGAAARSREELRGAAARLLAARSREEPSSACLPRVAARLLAARSRRSPVSQPRPPSRPRVLAARRSPNRVRPRGARSGSARPR
jgi:hypothetical protein